ncbi:hypothetical protein ACH5RR_013484 [Cinchona calisaya]|uniref:Myb-like domain-containing protein n=1 Tax=Cinchona calisaya TaxID=153742 RepID=A0ABD3A2U2_9GENT
MGYNQKISSNWTCSSSFWTREEDKAFENALAIYYDTSNLWEKIAAAVPGKTREEIKDHFQVLIADVNAIESGLVPLPRYTDSSKKSRKRVGHAALDKKGKQTEKNQSESGCSGKSSRSDSDRKRGKLWSKEEHM